MLSLSMRKTADDDAGQKVSSPIGSESGLCAAVAEAKALRLPMWKDSREPILCKEILNFPWDFSADFDCFQWDFQVVFQWILMG